MHNNLMPSQKSDALFLKQVRFYVRIPSLWRDGRAAQGACLENRYRETYRGFESHFLRSGLTTEYWGGARVDDWGRLLSGCRSKIRPRVRIPASPPDKRRSTECLFVSPPQTNNKNVANANTTHQSVLGLLCFPLRRLLSHRCHICQDTKQIEKLARSGRSI